MKKKSLLIALLLSLSIVGCSTDRNVSSAPDSSNSSESISRGSDPATIAVTGVTLNNILLELYRSGSSSTLVATVAPSNATNKEVIWSTSNPDVATVNNGVVTPIGLGTATITVKTIDGNKTANCQVRVKQNTDNVSSYVLYGLFNGATQFSEKPLVTNPGNPGERMIQNVSLSKGDIFIVHMLGSTFYDFDDVKTSSTTNAVEEGPVGYIKVKTPGVYNIYSSPTASSGGHIHVKRTAISVDSVSLNKTGKFMIKGSYFNLVASISPSDADNKNITWETSKPSVATVNNGRIYGVNDGKCTITATTQDGNKTATCVVFVSTSGVPMFYLRGTVGGDTIDYCDYKYPAIIDTTDYYMFYDVEVYPGDSIQVWDNTGHYKTDYYDHNKPYEFTNITEHKVVTLRLDVLNSYHHYLSIVE